MPLDAEIPSQTLSTNTSPLAYNFEGAFAFQVVDPGETK
jgi:hypothetical protein